MEDSDDNLSFVSASDSEYEEAKTHLKNPFVTTLQGSQVGIASSPALSLVSRSSSFRRTTPKRPAPQPPKKVQPSDAVPPSTPPSVDPTPMTKSVEQLSSGVEEEVEDLPPNLCSDANSERVLSDLVSHPVHLMTSKEEGQRRLDGGLDESQSHEQPGRNFNNLQLRLIDDVAEPLSQSHSSSSSFSTTFQTQGMIHHHPPPVSPIYSSFFSAQAHHPFPNDSAPFYVASVQQHHANDPTGGLVSLPVHSSPFQFPRQSPTAQYVPVAPLTYVPQISSQPQTLYDMRVSSPQPGFGHPAMATSGVSATAHHPLCHSMSDPGLNQVLRNEVALLRPGRPSLDRLSEERDDDDVEDDSYEDVFVRRDSNEDQGRRRSGGRRLAPSDSVAHLYEDILVSSRLNLKVTFTNLAVVVVAVAFFMPNSAALLFNVFRLVFGTLFPAYYSYKAVRTKNVKEYVKWMMYWIVFAFFTCAETITDVLVSFWFPFYYEIKILVVLWLLSPATRGSSILYRKFVHPWLTRKEEEIDDCIAKARQQGYTTVVQLGTKGVNYATSIIMQTALKGGGGIVSQLKRSYSASEIGDDAGDLNRNNNVVVKALPAKEHYQSPSEEEDVSISSGSYDSEPRHRSESESSSARTRGHSTGRVVRAGKTRSADVSDVYFPDTADSVTQRRSPRTHDAGRTTEGGSHQNLARRSRSGDVAYATLPRTTTKRTIKKRQA